MPQNHGMHTPVLDIICLCAAWCGTCREYEATFAQLQQALPGHRYRWIDIEDEAELAGDVDVETFPTLLVAQAGRVLFAGPVLPRLSDAQRLVEVQVHQAAQGQFPAATALGLAADQVQAFTDLARQVHAA
jgi:thioredoxin 1